MSPLFTDSLLIAMALLLIVSTVIYFLVYRAYQKEIKRNHDLVDSLEIENGRLNTEIRQMDIDYSTKLLDFIREFTMQTSLLMFNQFKDNHDLSKVNKSQVESLIKEVSDMVYNNMNHVNIVYTRTLFNSEYVNTYIIQTVISTIKQLFEQAVESSS